MNEEAAIAWLRTSFDVSRETWAQLERLTRLIIDENARQNLISPTTIDTIWSRHIADSAQLFPLGNAGGHWIDVGSGAGLPGLVIAILGRMPVTLVELRRKRAEFLTAAIDTIGLRDVSVVQSDIQKVSLDAANISARAVAALPLIFDLTHHLANDDTKWVLPKGRNAADELETARASWQGVFHVEQSVTHPDSKIVVASQLVRKRA